MPVEPALHAAVGALANANSSRSGKLVAAAFDTHSRQKHGKHPKGGGKRLRPDHDLASLDTSLASFGGSRSRVTPLAPSGGHEDDKVLSISSRPHYEEGRRTAEPTKKKAKKSTGVMQKKSKKIKKAGEGGGDAEVPLRKKKKTKKIKKRKGKEDDVDDIFGMLG